MAILVPYDGSMPAQEALEHAVREYPDTEIVLLRVIELAGGSTGAGFELLRERFESGEVEADLSREVDNHLDADTDVRIETAPGKPARTIVQYAEDHDVEHIVMGSHGREGVSRALLGSVAENVIRRSPVPVTIVR